MVDIAQLVRAPDCGSGGRRFESDYPPHFNTAAALTQCIGYAAGLKTEEIGFNLQGLYILALNGKSFLMPALCWDVAKLVRHRILVPAFRRFESCHPSQIVYFISGMLGCSQVGKAPDFDSGIS